MLYGDILGGNWSPSPVCYPVPGFHYPGLPAQVSTVINVGMTNQEIN